MPRQRLDLERVSYRLYRGDNARLAAYYGAVGINNAVRAIIRRHLNFLDEQQRRNAPGELVDLSVMPVGDITDLIEGEPDD